MRTVQIIYINKSTSQLSYGKTLQSTYFSTGPHIVFFGLHQVTAEWQTLSKVIGFLCAHFFPNCSWTVAFNAHNHMCWFVSAVPAENCNTNTFVYLFHIIKRNTKLEGWRQSVSLVSRVYSVNKTFCLYCDIRFFICPIIHQNLVTQSNENFSC